MFQKEFLKAIKESIGSTNVYTDLKENVPLDNDSYELTGSDKVSLLTEDDVQSVATRTISGLDFLSELPNVYTSENNLPFDLTPYKQKATGEVLKITVTLLPESYSGSADSGGSAHIGKIQSGYGTKVTEAMDNVHGFNEGALQAEGDIYSNAIVTYYFDAQTLSPLAAVYTVTTDTAQKINVYQNEEEVGQTKPAGYVKLQIGNTVTTYYFFD